VSELGEMLRDARHKKHASLEEVAAATRIKVPFLAALEDGEYSTLPGPAYITGFLRNYASYLELHPEDVVQEYNSYRPIIAPNVRPATRVLAGSYHRENRTRFLWGLAAIVLLLAGAYAIKQYNDASAHSYTPLNVSPSSLGGTISPTPKPKSAKSVHVTLHAVAPVWVRVTVNGHRAFQGKLPALVSRHWTGSSVYILTMNGTSLKATVNGKQRGVLATRRGALVQMATPQEWRRVS
jgi:transcriptional regulator with XRE-family HTH domain